MRHLLAAFNVTIKSDRSRVRKEGFFEVLHSP